MGPSIFASVLGILFEKYTLDQKDNEIAGALCKLTKSSSTGRIHKFAPANASILGILCNDALSTSTQSNALGFKQEKKVVQPERSE